MDSSFKHSKEESLGFLLWQSVTIWQREIKSTLEPFGLSHSSFVILASLVWFKEHHIIATQTDIIKQTKLDKMTVSKSIKTLMQKNLTNQMENKNDTRAKDITLTTKGMELARKAIITVEQTDKLFFGTLDKQEQETLNKLFTKLKEKNDDI